MSNKNAIKKPKDAITKVKNSAIEIMDQNGDGQVDINDIIIAAVKTPGISVSRDAFLRKELFKYYPDDIVEEAVRSTPANAGIDPDRIDKIADDVIKFERNCVSGI